MVEAPKIRAAQFERASQQPGVFEPRIIDCGYGEGRVLGRWLEILVYQIIPKLSPKFKTMMLPGFNPIRKGGSGLLTLVRASQWTNEIAYSRSASLAQVGIARVKFCQAKNKSLQPAVKLLSLEPASKTPFHLRPGSATVKQFVLQAFFRTIAQIWIRSVSNAMRCLNAPYSPNHISAGNALSLYIVVLLRTF
jgi:hypothetical protein